MKRAVIMGATSGIGLEVARLLAAKGWLVGIAGRRGDRLSEICTAETNIIATKCIDVVDEKSPELLSELVAELGGMDLYVHSSGIGFQNVSLDEDKEMATVMTNAVGFTRMLTAVFHYFSTHPAQRGHIAVISSIAGTKGLGAAPAYSSTKRFQSHYVECLSQLASINRVSVDFTDIRPGFVATDLIKGGHYPCQLSVEKAAAKIVRAIERKKKVAVIDVRYRILVALWQLVPRFLWVRMRIASSSVRNGKACRHID
ncbi:MAG: SDR family NAD(P)-dependent oxidoreductase [Bacteroides sp.]|nr:SDR family NAD(P)-dependent oxidoreductase [Roseburia sp.]MCM1347706.1 SDR family NAD(P)-dependent oxidoreductase [Bacteroides sp.]MCM1421553.1 SDR family NAD(P)-dependent oxidoreductase [Bacteroides sp.]